MAQQFFLPTDIFLSQEAFEECAACFAETQSADSLAVITIQIKNLELIGDAYGRAVSKDIMQILGAQISLHLEECGCFTSYKKTSFTILRTYNDRISLSNWISHLEAHVRSQMKLSKHMAEIELAVGVYACEGDIKESITDMVEHSETAIKYSASSNEHIVFYEEEMRVKLLKEYELIKSQKCN